MEVLQWKDADKERYASSLEFYAEHYFDMGLTRGQLQLLDQSCYMDLYKKGLLDQIPTTERRGAKSKYPNPLEIYRNRYSHLTRGQLNKKNQALYMKLYRERLLHHVPLDLNDAGREQHSPNGQPQTGNGHYDAHE